MRKAPDSGTTTSYATGPEDYEAMVLRRRTELRASLREAFALKPADAPAVLEIGAGHGHFLASYAENHPEHWCLGIDQMSDRVRRAEKKRARAGRPNLAFVRCEAMDFLECLPEDARFNRVFVLFPDPWPKKRHHKNRLLNRTFFQTMAARCEPGARLFFRTDHLPYFEEVHETLMAHADWELEPSAIWPFEEVTVFQQRAASFSSLIARTSK